MSTHASPAVDDVELDELERDPYPFYARLRREAPVAHMPLLGEWLIARWDDCDSVARRSEHLGSMVRHLHEYFGPNILTVDGDEHKWLRDGVDPQLRPRAVQSYIEDRARPVAKRYVERIRERGRADATTDLLELISVRVIGDVLGLGDIEDATLQRWFHTLNMGMTDLSNDPQVKEDVARAMAELDEYMTAAIDRLTRDPDGSALSTMVHDGIRDGVTRTFDDLIGTIRVIILGGFQEPGHGAAASLLGLLMNPDQLKAVLASPDELVPAAVHEGLRWIAPFQITERQALADIDVAGVTIPAGSEIAFVLGSANRDESRYERGEEFDVFRPRASHASFGYGIHTCSGRFISAALERIMLEEVLAGLPNLRLDRDSEPRVFGFTVRGVKNMPVCWDA